MTGLTLLLGCYGLAVAAQIPRMDLNVELEQSAIFRIKQRCAAGAFQEVIALAKAFDTEVFPSAEVYYEASLCLNQQSELQSALRALNRALLISPNHTASLFDRAEIQLALGNQLRAKDDLERLLQQEIVHWAVFFRRAEIAGIEGNHQEFEFFLRRAFFEGLEVRLLLDAGPVWMRFVRDAELAPVLQGLVVLYADSTLWEQLLQRSEQ